MFFNWRRFLPQNHHGLCDSSWFMHALRSLKMPFWSTSKPVAFNIFSQGGLDTRDIIVRLVGQSPANA